MVPKELTKEQNDILIGSLLGDGQVQYNGSSCRVRFDYSIDQFDYAKWLAEKLKPFSKNLTTPVVRDKRTNKENKKVRFDTETNPIFNTYCSLFYDGVQRIIPSNIKDLLSSKVTLVVWFLDDGARRTDSNAFRLHTESLSLESRKLLQGALVDNFGIKTSINRHRNKGSNQTLDEGFLLHIGSKGGHAKKLNELIKPFVASEIPTMLYKFF